MGENGCTGGKGLRSRRSPWITSLAIALLNTLLFPTARATLVRGELLGTDGIPISGELVVIGSDPVTAQRCRMAQSTIVDGMVQVELPANPGLRTVTKYDVIVTSKAGIVDRRVWRVPDSATPLNIYNVEVFERARDRATTSVANGKRSIASIREQDIVGLPNDLGLRPVKGPGFGTNAVAVINADGQIDTAVGFSTDCVLLDGTTTNCAFVDNEVPSGTIDGTNRRFLLWALPVPSSLHLFRNGLLQDEDQDFTLTDNIITFRDGGVPQPHDTLRASYRQVTNFGMLADWQGRSLSSAGTHSNVSVTQILLSALPACTVR